MEYADSGTLRDYLKVCFNNLTWDDKFKLALQLAYAVSCLHDEKIVHRDLVTILHFIIIFFFVFFKFILINYYT